MCVRRRYHFLDGATGGRYCAAYATGDLAKGSATSDPDGFPLYYAGSRDNRLRVVALDRGRPSSGSSTATRAARSCGTTTGTARPSSCRATCSSAARTPGSTSSGSTARTAPATGCASGRGSSRGCQLGRAPPGSPTGQGLLDRVVRRVPPRDRVLRELGGSRPGLGRPPDAPARRSAAARLPLLDGRRHGRERRRRREGLYVASELERYTERSRQVGQLVKLNPRRTGSPLVWSVQLRRAGNGGKGGSWSTPAVVGDTVYVATNAGGVVAVDRRTGGRAGSSRSPGADVGLARRRRGVLVQGDCRGNLRAFDVTGRRPRPLWSIRLGGCIESTPAVCGRIFVGTRGGRFTR